jgi:hypothetical protein
MFVRRQFCLRLCRQRIFRRRRRGGGFIFFATGQQGCGQQQHEKFCRFHETSLPEAVAVFNQMDEPSIARKNFLPTRFLSRFKAEAQLFS